MLVGLCGMLKACVLYCCYFSSNDFCIESDNSYNDQLTLDPWSVSLNLRFLIWPINEAWYPLHPTNLLWQVGFDGWFEVFHASLIPHQDQSFHHGGHTLPSAGMLRDRPHYYILISSNSHWPSSHSYLSSRISSSTHEAAGSKIQMSPVLATLFVHTFSVKWRASESGTSYALEHVCFFSESATNRVFCAWIKGSQFWHGGNHTHI